MTQENLTEKIGRFLYNAALHGASPEKEEELHGREAIENLLERDCLSYREHMEDVYDLDKRLKKALDMDVYEGPKVKMVDRESGEKCSMELEEMVEYVDELSDGCRADVETWNTYGPREDSTIREIEITDEDKQVHIRYRTFTDPTRRM